MANVIKLKRGSGSDPSASDLVVGEVAIRTDSGKLFTKKDNGTIAEISGSGGGSDIFINTLSSSSGSGGGSAVFDDTATRFTLSNPPAVSAQQLLVSINGVIQKPNSGTSPSEGFAIDGNDIIFAAAPATGSDFFIVTYGSLNIAVPADNSVTSAKIADGAIVNADINASAAIAGTKIAPNFGSQNIVTTGNAAIGTTSASLPLTVVGANNTTFDHVGTLSLQGTDAYNSGNAGAGINFSGKFNSSNAVTTLAQISGIKLDTGDGTYDGALTFGVRNDSEGVTIERARINNSGNLGVGTTSPIARIDSQGNVSSTTQFSGFQGLRIQNSNGAALGVTADLNFVAGTGSDNRGAVIGVEFTSGFGNDLYFATNPNSVSNNDTPIERLRITSAGNVQIPNDSGKLQLGTSQDFNIYHDGSHSRIVDSGTGDLKIQTNTLQLLNAAGNEYHLLATENGDVNLYYDGSLMANTRSDGFEIRQHLTMGDSDEIRLGNSSDLKIYHDGSSSRIIAANHDLIVQSNGYAIRSENGSSTFVTINSSGIVSRGDLVITANTGSLKLYAQTGYSQCPCIIQNTGNNTAADFIQFKGWNGSIVGSISGFVNSTSYATSSDYRLKENEVAISDGITRLKTLKPYRFNFKTTPLETVDGFFAHEVTPAVPEAVVGEKDGTEMQGIDQSKLVPLLVAALQEAITKIETLETKVAALEAG